MRISDEEREHLESIVGQTQRSISDIMREAMEYFAANYGQIEARRKAV
jgi:predicted DNA-binding protein